MSFITNYLADLKDVFTGKVFAMDYNSDAVPFTVKLERAKVVLTFLVASDTIWVTPLEVNTAANTIAFGETRLFNNMDENDPVKALMSSTEYKEAYKGYKYFIVSFWPKIVETTSYMLFKDKVDVFSGKEGKDYYEAFRELFATNPEVILEESKLPNKAEDTVYGYTFMPLFKKALILGEKKDYVQKLVAPILAEGGVVIGAWSYVFNLLTLTAKTDAFRNVEYGCAFFYAEGNLLTVSWKLSEPTQVYARGKFIGKEQNTTSLAKQIKDSLADWLRRTGLKATGQRVNPNNFGIYYQGLETRHHSLLQEAVMTATGNKALQIFPLPVSAATHHTYNIEINKETQLIKAVIL